jgi:hypothetical protein
MPSYQILFVYHVSNEAIKQGLQSQIQPKQVVENSFGFGNGFVLKFQHEATRPQHPIFDVLLIVEGLNIKVESTPESIKNIQKLFLFT